MLFRLLRFLFRRLVQHSLFFSDAEKRYIFNLGGHAGLQLLLEHFGRLFQLHIIT